MEDLVMRIVLVADVIAIGALIVLMGAHGIWPKR